MALLSVKIEAPHHVASAGIGKNNVYGHALFSDGKRYRFRYVEEKDGADVVLWRPGPDDKRSSEIAVVAPKRNEILAEALQPMIPELVKAAVEAKAAEDAAKKAWIEECHAVYLKRAAGPKLYAVLEALLEGGPFEAVNRQKARLILAEARGEGRKFFEIVRLDQPNSRFQCQAVSAEEAWNEWAYRQQERPDREAYYVVEKAAGLDDIDVGGVAAPGFDTGNQPTNP